MRLTSDMLKILRHSFTVAVSAVAWWVTGPLLSEAVRVIYELVHYILFGNTSWFAWGTYYVPLRTRLTTLAYEYGCYLGTSLGLFLSLRYGDKLENIIIRLCAIVGIEAERPAVAPLRAAGARDPSPGRDRDPDPVPVPALPLPNTPPVQPVKVAESPRQRSATFGHSSAPPLRASASAVLPLEEPSPRTRAGSGSIIPVLKTSGRSEPQASINSPTREPRQVVPALPSSPTNSARGLAPDTPNLMSLRRQTLATGSPRTNSPAPPIVLPEDRAKGYSVPSKFDGTSTAVDALVDRPYASTPAAAVRAALTSPRPTGTGSPARPGSGQYTPLHALTSGGSSKPAAVDADRLSNGRSASSGSLARQNSSGALSLRPGHRGDN